ncbi:hypothetical protein B0I33_103101 [Prauserella shujinwangii]|uniref:LppX_LprAFG lipoprotein n=1 Tax=Prauserella shujinwangii TaxID=1453103 RepID=A0A2T0LY72_9PSEU|nr:hypothetical protein [Prauserella shujinwangii]PRX49068.1 hypothetical protein B0I33_103101 [Prauserella shujinwangii]
MRKTALAASGFALVLALGACGDSEGGTASPVGGDSGNGSSLFSDAQALVAAASEQTSQSKSSKFTMEMDMAGQKISANGEGVYDGANSKMAITMNMGGQTMEMRLVDRTMYMKLPGEAAAQMGGKEWVKVSADGTDPLSQQLGSSFDQMAEQSDPSKVLDQIKQAGEITNSEETTLDGQDVTHYTIELDFAKIADQYGAAGVSEEQMKQLADKVGKLPMELWLNGDNLPVQVSMDMAKVMEAAGAPAGQGGSMLMKYTDWGAPVNVEAPPADQVGEFPGGN